RFFFIKTLKRNWSVEETPYPKRPIRLPDVLSREEVERLIDSADSRLHRIADWSRAQKIVDGWEAQRLHGKLDGFAHRYCPIFRAFGVQYHWSVDQCEYATDIVFRRQADLEAIYGNLTRTAIHAVKADNIATFLGRRLSVQYEGEMGNRFDVRIEGTRIKHTMGPVSLKLY